MYGYASFVDIQSQEWRENPATVLDRCEAEVVALNKSNHLGEIVISVDNVKYAIPVQSMYIGRPTGYIVNINGKDHGLLVPETCGVRVGILSSDLCLLQFREILDWPQHAGKPVSHLPMRDLKEANTPLNFEMRRSLACSFKEILERSTDFHRRYDAEKMNKGVGRTVTLNVKLRYSL